MPDIVYLWCKVLMQWSKRRKKAGKIFAAKTVFKRFK